MLSPLIKDFLLLLYPLQELSKQIEGHTICALGDAAAWPVQVHHDHDDITICVCVCVSFDELMSLEQYQVCVCVF